MKVRLNTVQGTKVLLKCLVFIIAFWIQSIYASNKDEAFELLLEEKYEEAFPLIYKLARDGHPEAQGVLARMYGNGWGTHKNDREAFYWASRGIAKNDPTSQYVIGFIHWQGLAGTEKDHTVAIQWMEKSANAGYERAVCTLIEIYESIVSSTPEEESLHRWYERGVSMNAPCAMYSLGSALMYGSYGISKDHQRAANLLEKSAEQGIGLVTAGQLLMFGDESVRNGTKAESYLIASMANGLNSLDAATAAFHLATAYLFGEGAVEANRPKGHKLLEDLMETDFNYFSHELESKLFDTGIDRQRSTRKAVLSALLAMESEIKIHGAEEVITLGTWAGRHAIDVGFTHFIDLPDHLELMWYRLVIGTRDEQGLYKTEKAQFSKEVVEKSEGTSLNDFFELIRTFISTRESEIGPIEPRDLVNEGWARFNGETGIVDEPLAQILTEEGLRLAIRTRNIELQSSARNNLGVILGGAANRSIRNPRLANVHSYDGRDSYWGADNMLWAHYMGSIKLDPQEHEELKDRFRKETGSEHRTQTMPTPNQENLDSYSAKADFLKKHYVPGDTDIALEIAWTYESNASSSVDYQEALYWSRLSDDSERSKRIERIVTGDFVRDMPNYNGVIPRIFGITANETRGNSPAGLKGDEIQVAHRSQPVGKNSSEKLTVHALVIGNKDYKEDPLRNSVNDARAIASRLRDFGFFVTEAKNLTRSAFRDTLIKFSERAKNADVTIFFYAGHGMQLGGINYLLPTDINFSVPQEVVTFDGISLNDLKSRHLPGATKLIFIDACRNNPFSARTRGLQGRGLAPINVGTGTLISFATRDGSVALDSVGGSHSPYTQGLLKHIGLKEDVEIMLRSVGDEVMRLTNSFQQPWKYGALSGEKVIIPMLASPSK